MSYAFCVVPVAPIRIKPAHDAEMSSQLLFGEHVEMLAGPVNGFVEIACSHDGYKGYCSTNQLADTWAPQSSVQNFAADWMNTIYDNAGHELRIPFGSSLPKELEDIFDFSSIEVGSIQTFNLKRLEEVIKLYMNSPYLWGGRSVFGLDCSGFSQAVAKVFGKQLLRDAWQQSEMGDMIPFGSHRPGDLAFFDLNGKVVHVGVITDENEITHAYGKIRKDTFTGSGIINKDTGSATHSLYSIRRIF